MPPPDLDHTAAPGMLRRGASATRGSIRKAAAVLFRTPAAHILTMIGLAALLTTGIVLLLVGLFDAATSAISVVDTVKLSFSATAGVGGIAALVIAFRRQKDNETAEAREATKHFSERFGAATEQLGSPQANVRSAGAYALAHLADDWDDGRQTCINVLCNYIRMPYTPPSELIDDANQATMERNEARAENRQVRHTILDIIGTRLRAEPVRGKTWHGHDFNFTGATIDGANFGGVVLTGGIVDFCDVQFVDGRVDFYGAKFAGATVDFRDARFAGGHVDLANASVTDGHVDFTGAEFTGAIIDFHFATFADGSVAFGDADFADGKLDYRNARFAGGRVNFCDSKFTGAIVDFYGARFTRGHIDFRDSKFTGGHVDFRGTHFAGGTVTFSSEFPDRSQRLLLDKFLVALPDGLMFKAPELPPLPPELL